MRRALAVLTVGVACAAGCPSAEVPASADAALADSLAGMARRFYEEESLPGLAVGVIRDGQVVYRAGFGTTVAGGGQPVTPATLFHMASVTKPFVATTIVQLVEEQKLGLDDPIRSHLPYFTMRDPRAAGITLRQTLTHTAGFPDVTDYRWDHPEYDEGSLERWVRTLADSALIFAPDSAWQYSNIGFEVLADVIAKTTGQPFEARVQERILTPLGMAKSTLLMSDLDSTLMAFGHTKDSAGVYRRTAAYPYNRRHAASSTLHSNVDDMLRWAAANLARGSLDGATILQPASYDLLWHPERDLTAPMQERYRGAGIELPYETMAAGLSWFLPTRRGRQLVWHSGGDRGFGSDLVLVPDEGIGIVVMTNADGANPGLLSLRLLDAVQAAAGR